MKESRARHRWLVTLVCLVSWAGLPASSLSAQELEIEHDARLEGYGEPVVLQEGGSAMVWLAFAFCSAIALLSLFKDAKRSHLD